MKPYYCETPNPWKLWALAQYLGYPVGFVDVDPSQGENKTPQIVAINPSSKVSALDDGE